MTDEPKEAVVVAAEAEQQAKWVALGGEALLAEDAHRIFLEINARRTEIASQFLELGRLFKRVRDEKLYLALDVDSFDEFLGIPEICFRRSTAWGLVHLYEIFVLKLKGDPEFLAQIGHAKLQVVVPVVEQDPENWLFKAKELSRADLITEVRTARGLSDSRAARKPEGTEPGGDETYEEWVRQQPCAVGGEAPPSDGAHIPKTKGSGAPGHWVVPLCRKCHGEYHADPQGFLWRHKNKVFGFLYDLILKLWRKP